MADLIQFSCPACGIPLRLPQELAGVTGPCPACRNIIQAPIPAAPEPEPPAAPEPLVIPEPAAALDPTVPAEPPAPRARPAPTVRLEDPTHAIHASHQRAVLVLSCLLSATVSFIIGYALGARFSTTPWEQDDVPPPQPAPPPVVIPVEPPAAPPEVIREKPARTIGELPEPTREVASSAEATLRAFLDAPDWAARSSHVLFSDEIVQLMELRSHETQDGPITHDSLRVLQTEVDESTNKALIVFNVTTRDIPSGFPVAVMETDQGWRVDWESFIEFHDDRFRLFAEGPPGRKDRFRLVVNRPPESETTTNEHYGTFLIEPPLPNRRQTAYARIGSSAHTILNAALEQGANFTAILELSLRETPDGGRAYIEITGVPATDWRPREP